jgi:hypothetical protein
MAPTMADSRSGSSRGTKRLAAPLLLVLLIAASGCSLTQTEFAQRTDEAAAVMAGAATVLAFAHEQRITGAYARATLASYAPQLEGLDRELAGLKGAPDPAAVRQLVELSRPAREAVDQPCLDEACDWRGQVEALRRAVEAFKQASGA